MILRVRRNFFEITTFPNIIDVYLTNTRSSAWVFDTGYVAHICNSKHGLWIKGRLSKDEVRMHVGNGSKVDVIAVGSHLEAIALSFGGHLLEICPRGNNKLVIIIIFPCS